MEPQGADQKPHVPPPSLWPLGFAVGIACILVGLVVSFPAAAVGAVLTAIFGFLWVRDVMRGGEAPPHEAETVEVAPDAPAIPAHEGPAAMPPGDRFPRSRFLEAVTVGLGAAIGGLVTLPVLGPAVAHVFRENDVGDIDVGALDDFPEGEFVIATFLSDPAIGEVSRRTAYIRNNGLLKGKPSFTIVSNRCVHLGCPVQPQGLQLEEQTARERTARGVEVTRIPTKATAGFGCPCHGGAYDREGNVKAGPPVRALDRYDFAVRNGRLILRETYSVSEVKRSGAEARIKRYDLANPGVHVTGAEAWLYPVEAGDV